MIVRRALVLVSAGVVATGSVVVLAMSPAAAGDDDEWRTDLTGAAERPGPGDPDGSGTARVRIRADEGEVCYRLRVEDIGPATAAHIHIGRAGEPGPVVVPLQAPTDGRSQVCEPIDADIAQDILADPSGYYVNVHNAEFGPGALRGQLGSR